MAISVPGSKVGTKEWSTGLFGCFDDCSTCMLGWCCPCFLYGFNQEKINGQPGWGGACCAFFCLQALGIFVVPLSSLICPGTFACCISGPKREHLRSKYGLKEDPCGDCLVHCFCIECALCQEARELKYQLANPVYVKTETIAPPPQAMSPEVAIAPVESKPVKTA